MQRRFLRGGCGTRRGRGTSGSSCASTSVRMHLSRVDGWSFVSSSFSDFLTCFLQCHLASSHRTRFGPERYFAQMAYTYLFQNDSVRTFSAFFLRAYIFLELAAQLGPTEAQRHGDMEQDHALDTSTDQFCSCTLEKGGVSDVYRSCVIKIRDDTRTYDTCEEHDCLLPGNGYGRVAVSSTFRTKKRESRIEKG